MVFLLAVIPTIPASFLTTAESVLYQGYNHEPRLWGLSVIEDQQLAGIQMKIITGFYLWGIIGVIFFKWSLGGKANKSKFRGKLVRSDGSIPSGTEAPPQAEQSLPSK